ncbi:MAG: DUF421 domain-containing protein [Eubacteriales bacterium]
MLILYIRTIIIYFALLLTLRFMGKRQIGELRVSELIITLLLSEIAVQPITDRNKPILYALIPILLLLAVEVIVSFLLLKSNLFKKLFYGSPTILVKRGKLLQKELKRNRIEADELISELRQKGFAKLDDIYYVVLEENGKLSVFPKAKNAPATPEDLGLNPSEIGVDHLIIIDGYILRDRLSEIGWDERRLDDEIKRSGLRLEEIFIMTADDSGKVTCIRKEKK